MPVNPGEYKCDLCNVGPWEPHKESCPVNTNPDSVRFDSVLKQFVRIPPDQQTHAAPVFREPAKDHILPHKYRPERRAVHLPALRLLRYEFQNVAGDWVPDYTTHESAMQTEYFKQFYGSAEQS